MERVECCMNTLMSTLSIDIVQLNQILMNVCTCLAMTNSVIIQCNAQRCHNMYKSSAYRSVSMRITA